MTIAYILEESQVDKLKAIMRRLYDEKRLEGDERRDLANAMFATLEGLSPIKESDWLTDFLSSQ